MVAQQIVRKIEIFYIPLESFILYFGVAVESYPIRRKLFEKASVNKLSIINDEEV